MAVRLGLRMLTCRACAKLAHCRAVAQPAEEERGMAPANAVRPPAAR